MIPVCTVRCSTKTSSLVAIVCCDYYDINVGNAFKMMKARMVFIQEFQHLVQISPLNRVLIIVATQRRPNSLPRQNVRGNRRPILIFTTRYHGANADRGSAIIFILYSLIFLVTLPKNSPCGSTNEYNCDPTRAEPSFAFD